MSTETQRTAEDICTALGTTVEEVRESAERVDRLVEFIDESETVTTSATIAGVDVHLHQLVVDLEDDDYVVIRVEESFIQVANPETWTRFTITRDELEDGLVVPRTAPDGTPIFAY